MKRRDSFNNAVNKRSISDTMLLAFVVCHSLRVLSFYPLDYAMRKIYWLPTSFFTAFVLTLCSALLLFFHQPCADYNSLKVLFRRENFFSLFVNGIVLAVSLQCWLYGLRNTSAGCTAIFEAGGLCMATIVSACLKPVRTERGRLRLFYAILIIIGYIIVTVSPVGHGALVDNDKAGIRNTRSKLLIHNVHEIIKRNEQIANNNIVQMNTGTLPQKLRGKSLDDNTQGGDVHRRRRRRLFIKNEAPRSEKVPLKQVVNKKMAWTRTEKIHLLQQTVNLHASLYLA